MTYVDSPDKKQKHPHYEHRTLKLDLKDNEFSSKKFQSLRNYSTEDKIFESFSRIAMCLNEKPKPTIPTKDLNKVCLILMNDRDFKGKNLGVGPLNDGYLVGLKHHRFGFKVFYLFNCENQLFRTYLKFFLINTTDALTVFYSGRDDKIIEGIEFSDSTFSKIEINDLLMKNCNGKTRVLFITDSVCGKSVFNVEGCSNMISLSVKKSNLLSGYEIEKTHGIFTYYFCKITSDCPNITPNRLVERMNASLDRFDEEILCQLSNKELGDSSIFF
ncbi:hypothetical protein M9Y10_019357 [Tritrichomonas musculus]|uniref:Uncharacterized protein n=1 Tax=Tritrichomonas musculus TaxID=1915356 RepID=A0ABR2HKR5_9EUKA